MDIRSAAAVLEDAREALQMPPDESRVSLSSPNLTKKQRKAANASEKLAASLASRSGSATTTISASELNYLLTPHDMKRLELYGRNLCDYHLITDLIPALSRLYFTNRFPLDFSLSSVQGALMCGMVSFPWPLLGFQQASPRFI